MAESIKLFEHPDYNAKKDGWTVARDLYQGIHKVVCGSGYLWKHHIECAETDGALQYQRRATRTRYLNLSEILISIWSSTFFKKAPDVTEVEDLFGEAIDNVDGFGTGLATLVQEKILYNLLNYGKVIAFVQASPISGQTVADVASQNGRPFISIVDPLSVVDWDIEARDPARVGKYNFIRYEQVVLLPRLSALEPPKLVLRSEAHEIRDGGYIISVFQAEIDEHGSPKLMNGEIAWEKVAEHPIRRVSGKPIDEIPVYVFEGQSWLKDANQESIRYHNLRSRKDNIEHYQMYQEIWYRLTDRDAKRIHALGETARTILGPEEEMGAVPAANTAGWQEALNDSLLTAFRVGLNQLRQLPMDSRVGQAEGSISAEKENTTALVLSTIEEIENYTNQIIQGFASFLGQAEFEGEIKLSRDIDTRNIEQAISQFQVLEADMRKVPTWIKTELKSWVDRGDYSDEDKATITEEIEKGSFTPEKSFTQNRQSLIDTVINGDNEGTNI